MFPSFSLVPYRKEPEPPRRILHVWLRGKDGLECHGIETNDIQLALSEGRKLSKTALVQVK